MKQKLRCFPSNNTNSKPTQNKTKTFVWLKATKAQERQLEFTGSAKIVCAKGLFAGETGLVGFCVVWTRGTRFLSHLRVSC